MSTVESGTWWSAPAEAEENGKLIIVTGRKDVDTFRKNPRFSIRVEISISYETLPDGMPDKTASEQLEIITDNFQAELKRDPVAILVGMITGDGKRDWIFYTLSTNIFNKKLNAALAELPMLPLDIKCYNDPQWEAYDEIKDTEILMD